MENSLSYEQFLDRMRAAYEEKSGTKAEECSDLGIRLRVLAGELYALSRRLHWLEGQMYPQTATGESLEKHCEQRGLKRKGAARARGTLKFLRRSVLEYSVLIPAGTVCAVEDGSLRYVTADLCRIPAGGLSAEAPAEAEEGGAAYNCGAGKVTVLVSLPVGVESVTNETGFTGGMDRESDEALRGRLLECCATFPDGANAAYYRQLALSSGGITSANVTSSGPGQVTVWLWGTGEAPGEEALAELNALFREKRELNAAVTATAAEPLEYQAYLDVKPEGCSFETARAEVIKAVTAYFSTLKVGDPVLKSRLGEYVMGHSPISNYRFPTAVADQKGNPSKIPVLSSVNVGEMP